jgi:outer membrane protein assembly factor BamB
MRRQTRLVLIAVALVCASLIAAGCAPARPAPQQASVLAATSIADSSWPSYGHDAQRTNRSSAVGPKKPVKKWAVPGLNVVEPAIGSDGMLYVGDGDGVSAVDPSDGSTRWRARAGSRLPCVPAVLNDGRVVITGIGASRPFETRPYVLALDSSGRELWRTWLGEGVSGPMEDGFDVSKPAVGRDGTIYVGGGMRPGMEPTGAVWAIDPADGSILWAFSAKAMFREVALAPTGVIYAYSWAGQTLLALNPDGSKRWSVTAEILPYSGFAVGRDATVYFLDEFDLVAVGPDGHKRWKYPTNARSGIAIGSDGTLYFANGRLFAVSPRGKKLWTAKVDGWDPVMVDGAGTIYLQDASGWLNAVSRGGKVKWRLRVGQPTQTVPVIGPSGTIYVGQNNGTGGGLVAVGSAK